MERHEPPVRLTPAGSVLRPAGSRVRRGRLNLAVICGLFGAMLLCSPGTPASADGPASPAFPAPDLTPALKSRKLMPASLQQQLTQRERSLADGFAQAEAPATPADARQALRTELDRQIRLLAGTPAFDDVVFQFGRIARLVYGLNAWKSYVRAAGDDRFLADFSLFAQRKTPKFVPVFYDYSTLLFRDRDPDAYMTRIIQRNEDYTRRILDIYRAGGNSRQFDERSPAFGLAALQYSHTITDIANLWLFCWREANGDMAGTPFYSYPQSTPSAEKRQ